jgi:N-acetylglucosamine-6-sulfatase
LPAIRRLLAGCCALAAAAGLGGCFGSGHSHRGFIRAHRPSKHHPVRTTSADSQPNIVFVLTDDLSMNLLPYMPHVLAMERAGLTFNNYFVSDSLCCPSRASIFTGNFPHDTGVFQNTGSDGGFDLFHFRGEERQTFATALQSSGYATAMMGKYLNHYLQSVNVPDSYVPPGWSEWDVAGWGYPEFDYTLNQNGALVAYDHRPADYLTDVLARKGSQFIDAATAAGDPFMLELATFAPHAPYTPAPRDRHDFPGLQAPRPTSFDTLPANPPRWLAGHPPLTLFQMEKINRDFRRRARSVQAVDQLIGRIEQTLVADGQAQNTYIVFSSDNGYHMGEYRLMPGKLTAFDTDIHVPLVVTGPGVPSGATSDAVAENIDLAKTFATIGGTDLPGDGHTLLPLLQGHHPADWRNAALVEHHGSDLSGKDPDYQQTPAGNPRTYEAMRTPAFLYVEYDDGEREFYDLRSDPFELHNLAGALSAARLEALHAELVAMANCHDSASCWQAMHVRTAFAVRLARRRTALARGARARRHHRRP